MRFFLARTKCSRDLDCDAGFRKIDREVCDFRYDETFQFTGAELGEEFLTFLNWSLTFNNWDVESGSNLIDLVDVLADDEGLVVLMLFSECKNYIAFSSGAGAGSILLFLFDCCVSKSFMVGECDANFDTFSRSDIALGFDLDRKSTRLNSSH